MAQEKTESSQNKKQQEEQLTDAMGQELTDEQLERLAEGSSSWGANCNKGCH
jgi:hypothetical protein